MKNKQKKIISLLGPTGIGKSSIALKLAKKYPIEIISVDSVMIYRDMNIGTDKPSNEVLSAIKHHLVDIRNPNETYNVGQFHNDIRKVIRDIHSNEKIPLLVGGSMMYFNSLFNGLSSLPVKNVAEREFIDSLLINYSSENLHDCLKYLDSESYRNINKNDMQRIQRTLEVYLSTGKPRSSFYSQGYRLSNEYDLLTFSLVSQNRSLIHNKISSRTNSMFENNFIDEVVYIIEKYHLTSRNQSMRSIGYKQIFSYLKGNLKQDELKDRCIYATRQLAKRQITWLKKFNGITTIDIGDNSLQNLDKDIDNYLHF